MNIEKLIEDFGKFTRILANKEEKNSEMKEKI